MKKKLVLKKSVKEELSNVILELLWLVAMSCICYLIIRIGG